MIRSMTAFARQETQAEWGSLTCEVRTVNHRYLEPQFRLPESLRDLEVTMRDLVRDQLRRGKVDIGMRLQLTEGAGGTLSINQVMAEQVNEAANLINRMLDNPAHINALDILRWPGVLENAEFDMEPVKEAARALMQATLREVVSVREREGGRLRPLFDERLDRMNELVGVVRQRMPELLERQQVQLRQRFEDARVELESDRLTQEMVLLAQKCDVAEEMDRLDAHIKEIREALDRDESIGRRLDFLMQELNREANTLSSKSIDADVTKVAVELKVLIEQMREQVQNIE
ncbi:YicC/YloC family endoribonuclease [Mangrovitalea sediminis]|uniref:YicC/YloC family endoribonuclease n=1 Tax=Mangrovitalea sediminis TaxID=1982043 RepID=UPI000BE5D899|nr:YicC/YloC family endoribonuclease [Mangrovitalea sediminis]